MTKLLTKSNYITGLQCSKLLWITKNDKERIPKPTDIEQSKFDSGSFLGELATLSFSDGVDLSKEGFRENLDKTKEAIVGDKPIFEASFVVGELYSRADILNPRGDEWDLIEVKSSTKVKDISLHDIAFQKHVYKKAGVKIGRCFLMHINNEYARDGEIEPKELFIQTDVTEMLAKYEEDLESNISKMLEVIKGEEPAFKIEDILTTEYSNICLDEFMESLPEENIFEFYRMFGKKKVELYKDGYKTMKDVPESVKLNDKQMIQKRLASSKDVPRSQMESAGADKFGDTGGVHTNKTEINNFLNNLQYPIYYLDFETINPAIPKFDGMKPYQRIPFQFSLHVQEEKGGELKHVSFLAEGGSDPREKFMQCLKDNLGSSGSVLVYNQGFEKGVMNECATAYPAFRTWYDETILPRIKDLWDVFRNFDYYDVRQKGSASIKYVLPVLSDLSYSELDIGNGLFASYEFERITFGEAKDIVEGDLFGMSPEEISGLVEAERLKVREALERYCEMDTMAEVKIVDGLNNLINNDSVK